MKKSVLCLIAGGLVLGTIGTVAGTLSTNRQLSLLPDGDGDFNATFNNETSPSFEGGNCWGTTVVKSFGDFTNIEFYDCEDYGNAFVHIGGNGYFFKQQASNDLTCATITYSGSIKFITSYSSDFSDSEYVILDSGYTAHSGGQYHTETIYLNGNYWKIEHAPGTAAVIASLSIDYDCSEAATRPASADPTAYSASDNWAKLVELNGKLYFTFDLVFDGKYSNKNNYALYSTQAGVMTVDNIRAEFLKYGEGTVAPFFNLTDWYASLGDDAKNAMKAHNWVDISSVTFNYDPGTGLDNFNGNANIQSTGSVATTYHLLDNDLQMNIWKDGGNAVRFSIGKVISGFNDDGNGNLYEAGFEPNNSPEDHYFKLTFQVKKEQWQPNVYQFYRRAFSVKTDHGSFLYPYHVTYEENTYTELGYRNIISLYFSFSALAASSGGDETCYMHLYYFESPWNGGNGDFKRAGSPFGNTGKVQNWSYTEDGNKYEYGYLYDIPVVYISKVAS